MIPASLQANPRLGLWVGFETPGRVRVAFGKVEYGQGVATALAQIAAEELDVAFERLDVAPAATGVVPDEGMTVGSMSVEVSGAALRAACAEARGLFLAEAARRLDCGPERLTVRGGAILRDQAPSGLDYWSLAPWVDLAIAPTGEARPKAAADYQVVGRDVPRLDLPDKVFGAGFLHDMMLPGLRHARVLRQPGPQAQLVSLDEARISRAAGGEVDILVERAFVALIADSEAVAARAHAAAEASAVWQGAREVSPATSDPTSLKDMPSVEFSSGAPAAGPSNRRRVQAAYSRPYIAHGSMAPSCGIALFEDGRLTVWEHGQGVYPQRGQLARLTGLDPEAIEVVQVAGAGCYGHNGSDDAAYDAAIIALRRPGRPVRVQWRREDEFGHSPVGAAMRIEMTGELDAAGRLVDFSTEIWNGPHTNRGTTLMDAALPREGFPPVGPDPAVLARFSGGRLNAVPSYDIPAARVTEHVVMPTPVRTSSLRGLGGPVNTYAGECFVDELAEAAGQDPLAFRLGMISDPRAREVLDRLAARCGWAERGAAGSGRGLGLAYDRHRDRGGYVAVAALLAVDVEVRLERLWCVADCGLIINPDGAKNQIEGGMIMAASWALKEQVRLGGTGIETTSWDDYPILRFDEVPPVEIELIVRPQEPPFGIGELSMGSTMGAIANAVAHALGARVRDMPFTRDRIAQSLVSA